MLVATDCICRAMRAGGAWNGTLPRMAATVNARCSMDFARAVKGIGRGGMGCSYFASVLLLLLYRK